MPISRTWRRIVSSMRAAGKDASNDRARNSAAASARVSSDGAMPSTRRENSGSTSRHMSSCRAGSPGTPPRGHEGNAAEQLERLDVVAEPQPFDDVALALTGAGTKIATYGLTEPSAGSDVRGVQTVAVKKGDRYVVAGEKMWISLADVADNFLVFAWSDLEKKKQRDPSGFSAFILERAFKGF